MLNRHVLEFQDILVREELHELDLAEGGDGKLWRIVVSERGDCAVAEESIAPRSRLAVSLSRPECSGTYAVFLVVHDDLLERDMGAGLFRACAMDLTTLADLSATWR